MYPQIGVGTIGKEQLHKKLDRSLSAGPLSCAASNQHGATNGTTTTSCQQQQPTAASQANSSRYKTELCRPFEENGACKYGDKCQFAHGYHELRNLQRHPKYKTELCRTFHTTGLCPYGPRCHFIHMSEESKKSVMSTLQAGGGTTGCRFIHELEPKKAVLSGSISVGGKPSSAPIGGGGRSQQHIPGLERRTQTIPILAGLAHATPAGDLYSGSNSYSSWDTPPAPTRPKALSIGSFSLLSSGDLSPPSSPSGSPSSLAEDPFGSFAALSAPNSIKLCNDTYRTLWLCRFSIENEMTNKFNA